jgi:NADH dehydrogenase/NADH:ubiquinone oxidoreductase subunit G
MGSDNHGFNAPFKVFLGSNGSNNLLNYDVILPVQSYLEKDCSYLNCTGLLQSTNKVSTNVVQSRSEEDVFKSLLYYLSNCDSKNFFKEDYNVVNGKNFFDIKGCMGLKNLNFKNISKSDTFYVGKTLSDIDDYFLSNSFSKNSRVMKECSLLNSNLSNF